MSKDFILLSCLANMQIKSINRKQLQTNWSVVFKLFFRAISQRIDWKKNHEKIELHSSISRKLAKYHFSSILLTTNKSLIAKNIKKQQWDKNKHEIRKIKDKKHACQCLLSKTKTLIYSEPAAGYLDKAAGYFYFLTTSNEDHWFLNLLDANRKDMQT